MTRLPFSWSRSVVRGRSQPCPASRNRSLDFGWRGRSRRLFSGQLFLSCQHNGISRHPRRGDPDAVFTHWLIDNHPDHRAIANLTYESWKQLKHRFALYYYEVSDGEDTTQFPTPTLVTHEKLSLIDDSYLNPLSY